MVQEKSGIQVIDSLSANEFKVEVDGQEASGIFAVRGLVIHRVDLTTGRLIHPPLMITKMVQQDPNLPMNRWTRETLAAPNGKVTRELAIVAMDEGMETRRWVYKEAWISDISLSDFDSAISGLVEERLTIQHSGVEEIWPAR